MSRSRVVYVHMHIYETKRSILVANAARLLGLETPPGPRAAR